MLRMMVLCLSMKFCGLAGRSWCTKNSPGTLRVVPYNISAGELLWSSLYVVRSPSMTEGSKLVQGMCGWHIKAALNDRCQRSIIPFEAGW